MSVQQTSPGDSRSDEAKGELLPTQNTIGFDQGTSYTHGTINVDTQAIVSKKYQMSRRVMWLYVNAINNTDVNFWHAPLGVRSVKCKKSELHDQVQAFHLRSAQC